jgi:hypothetical protein
VLRLGLHDGWYDWEFVPDGQPGTFRDAGRDDCVQPPPTIASGPEGFLSGSRVRFSFSGRSAAGFECRLDGGAWRRCSSTAEYAGLSEGEHVFLVRAASPTGIRELAAAERRFTIDRTPPEVRTSVRAGRTLTGVVPLDAAVFDAAPVAEVRWLLDGRVIAVDDTAPWTAAWDSSRVRNGRHRLVVQARDAAGNVGATRSIPVTIRNRRFLAVGVTVPERTRLRTVLTRGLALRARCSQPCRLTARLELDSRTARRLGVPRRIASAADSRLRQRRDRVRLSVRPAVRRRLSRARRLTPRVVLVVTDAGRRSRVVRRSVLLRR